MKNENNYLKRENKGNKLPVGFDTVIPKPIDVFRYIEPFALAVVWFGLSLNVLYGNRVIASIMMPLGFIYIVFEIVNGMYWRVERDFDDYDDEINITKPLVHEWCAVFIYIMMYENASKYIPQIPDIAKILVFVGIMLFTILLNVRVQKTCKKECEKIRQINKILTISDVQFDTICNSVREEIQGNETEQIFDKFRYLRTMANDPDTYPNLELNWSDEENAVIKKLAAVI